MPRSKLPEAAAATERAGVVRTYVVPSTWHEYAPLSWWLAREGRARHLMFVDEAPGHRPVWGLGLGAPAVTVRRRAGRPPIRARAEQVDRAVGTHVEPQRLHTISVQLPAGEDMEAVMRDALDAYQRAFKLRGIDVYYTRQPWPNQVEWQHYKNWSGKASSVRSPDHTASALTMDNTDRELAFMLDWAEPGKPLVHGSQEALTLRAGLVAARVPATIWGVVRALFPLLDATAPTVASLVSGMKVAIDIVQNTAGWDAGGFGAALGMAQNRLLLAALEALRDVSDYDRYYCSLRQHHDPELDPSTDWLAEVLVRRLYRHGLRGRVDGDLLVPIPFGAPTDLRPEPRIAGWARPFPAVAKPIARFRTDETNRHELSWFAASQAAAVDHVHTVVNQVLRGAGGKLVLAGGAVLHAVTNSAHQGDHDLFLVGCKSKEEALAVVQAAVRTILGALGPRRRQGFDIVTLLSEHVLTVAWDDDMHSSSPTVVQFVLRLFRSPEEVVATFDLPICCFLWDGAEFRATRRALYAMRYGVVLADPMQQSTPRRAHKYNGRGFRFVVPGWDADWERLNARARDEMTKDELVEMVKDGGLRGIVAFTHLPLGVVDRESAFMSTRTARFAEPGAEIEASHLYRCLYDTTLLLNDAWRAAFLQHYPSYRAYANKDVPVARLQGARDEVADEVLPPELVQLLREEDEPRWLIRNPALRMYSVEQFYNLDVSRGSWTACGVKP